MTNKDLITECYKRTIKLEKPCLKCPYQKDECFAFRKKFGFDHPSFYGSIVLKLDEDVKADEINKEEKNEKH